MNRPRKVDLYLHDMITSMERIASYLEGHTFESFQKSFMVVDAVIRNFEIIGEASKNMPMEIREKYPNLPWQKMYQLRNIVSHSYFDVDHETVWEIAKKSLPQNLIDLKEVLDRETKN